MRLRRGAVRRRTGRTDRLSVRREEHAAESVDEVAKIEVILRDAWALKSVENPSICHLRFWHV